MGIKKLLKIFGDALFSGSDFEPGEFEHKKVDSLGRNVPSSRFAPKLHIIRTVDGWWTWTLNAGNGKVLCEGSNTYEWRNEARDAALNARECIQKAIVRQDSYPDEI